MSRLKNILYELTVSNQNGADYNSINEAISDIGSIKTFRIETAITLTDNITFPSGVTIIIGSQGSINGNYTLTGNNTTIKFEGFNQSFSTDVIFNGTYISDSIYPEYWGAIGDASLLADGSIGNCTDDKNAITDCFAFAKLTQNKTVNFLQKKILCIGCGF